MVARLPYASQRASRNRRHARPADPPGPLDAPAPQSKPLGAPLGMCLLVPVAVWWALEGGAPSVAHGAIPTLRLRPRIGSR